MIDHLVQTVYEELRFTCGFCSRTRPVMGPDGFCVAYYQGFAVNFQKMMAGTEV